MTRVFIALLLLLSQVASAGSYWTLPDEMRGNSEFTAAQTFSAQPYFNDGVSLGSDVKIYGGNIAAAHAATTLYKLAEFEALSSSQHATIDLDVTAGSSGSSTTKRVSINYRSNTLPSITVKYATIETLTQSTTYISNIEVWYLNAKMYIGYRTSAAPQNTSWTATVKERSNYGYWSQVSSLTVLDTTGMTQVTDSATIYALNQPITFSGGFAAQTIAGAVTWSGTQTIDVASPNQLVIKAGTVAGIEFKIGATTTWQTFGNATEWGVYNYAGTNFPLKLTQTAATINVPTTLGASGTAATDTHTVYGSFLIANSKTSYTNTTVPSIYATTVGGTGIFNEAGHLILEPRLSGATRDVIVMGTGGVPAARFNGGGVSTLGPAWSSGAGTDIEHFVQSTGSAFLTLKTANTAAAKYTRFLMQQAYTAAATPSNQIYSQVARDNASDAAALEFVAADANALTARQLFRWANYTTEVMGIAAGGAVTVPTNTGHNFGSSGGADAGTQVNIYAGGTARDIQLNFYPTGTGDAYLINRLIGGTTYLLTSNSAVSDTTALSVSGAGVVTVGARVIANAAALGSATEPKFLATSTGDMYGYTISSGSGSNRIASTWLSVASATTDYTVFRSSIDNFSTSSDNLTFFGNGSNIYGPQGTVSSGSAVSHVFEGLANTEGDSVFIRNNLRGGSGSGIHFQSAQNYGSNAQVTAGKIMMRGAENWTTTATTDSQMELYTIQDNVLILNQKLLPGGNVSNEYYTKLGEAVDGGAPTPAFAILKCTGTIGSSSPATTAICDLDSASLTASRVRSMHGMAKCTAAWDAIPAASAGGNTNVRITVDSSTNVVSVVTDSGTACNNDAVEIYIYYEAGTW